MQSYFVTGTDTDVGKTHVSAILLKAASEAGKKTVGYKPVSAGCEEINGRLVQFNHCHCAKHDLVGTVLVCRESSPLAPPPPSSPSGVSGNLMERV